MKKLITNYKQNNVRFLTATAMYCTAISSDKCVTVTLEKKMSIPQVVMIRRTLVAPVHDYSYDNSFMNRSRTTTPGMTKMEGIYSNYVQGRLLLYYIFNRKSMGVLIQQNYYHKHRKLEHTRRDYFYPFIMKLIISYN